MTFPTQKFTGLFHHLRVPIQPYVPDLVEPAWEHVQKESPQELHEVQCGGLPLPGAERDVIGGHVHQARVRNAHAMDIPPEIGLCGASHNAYLGRYTHRVGIANSRLLDVGPEHVLPDGFHKIRHAGLYACAQAGGSLERARSFLSPAPAPKEPPQPEDIPTTVHPTQDEIRDFYRISSQAP